MCELIPVCPINDHGDANITVFTIDPKKGPQGKRHLVTISCTI